MMARSALILVLVELLMSSPLTLSSRARAQQMPPAKTANTDEQRLIQKIKEEIMKELRQGDFLGQQIEIGIQKYIKKQQDAQAAARAQQERVAAEKAKNVRRVSASRDHIYGDPNAPVTLIGYSDFECPFCKQFHATAKELIDSYGGKVNWVYRHFPLPIHNPGALKQAEASECVNHLAGNEAFWKFADAIYARTQSGGNGFPLAQLAPLAKEVGVDEKQFSECFASGQQAARVKDDIDEAAQIGVNGTPANILIKNATGETALKTGALPLEALKPDVDRLLGKNDSPGRK